MRFLLVVLAVILASQVSAREQWVIRFQIDHGLSKEEGLALERKILNESAQTGRDSDEVAASYFKAFAAYRVIDAVAKANLSRDEYMAEWNKSAHQFQLVFNMTGEDVDEWFDSLLRKYEGSVTDMKRLGSVLLKLKPKLPTVSYSRIRGLSEEAIKILDEHPVAPPKRIRALTVLLSQAMLWEGSSKGLGSKMLSFYGGITQIYTTSNMLDAETVQSLSAGFPKALIDKARSGDSDAIDKVFSLTVEILGS